MKVAVAGTGGLAQNIARAIMDRQHEVVMLSRFERPELRPNGFTVVRVDYSHQQSLETALSGVDTVISTVSNEPQLALIDACLTASVRRFAPAEFEGVPFERPMIEQCRDKITTLSRLREVRDRLQSTVFCCGIFYEWFYPGGLIKSGVSSGSVIQIPGFGAEGAFMVDMKNNKARIPVYSESGKDVYACFTSVSDVGKFVARCLDIESWPEQLRMCGERLKLSELAGIVGGARGRKLDVVYPSSEELHDQLLDAEDTEDSFEVFQLEALIATQRGEFDFRVANVNQMFPEFQPTPLKEWLQNTWRGEAA